MKSNTLFRFSIASFLFLLTGVCAVISFANTQRTSLSLEERIAYQKKLEQVYWRHRTATQSAGQTKSFAEAMPEAKSAHPTAASEILDDRTEDAGARCATACVTRATRSAKLASLTGGSGRPPPAAAARRRVRAPARGRAHR